MYFIQLAVQQKGEDDYRAFLYYKENFDSPEEHEIRGYGNSIRRAADDAINKYSEL